MWCNVWVGQSVGSVCVATHNPTHPSHTPTSLGVVSMGSSSSSTGFFSTTQETRPLASCRDVGGGGELLSDRRWYRCTTDPIDSLPPHTSRTNACAYLDGDRAVVVRGDEEGEGQQLALWWCVITYAASVSQSVSRSVDPVGRQGGACLPIDPTSTNTNSYAPARARPASCPREGRWGPSKSRGTSPCLWVELL